MRIRIKKVPQQHELNARKWKHGLGGNLFSGKEEGSQQMDNGLNLFRNTNRAGDVYYTYQNSPDGEEVRLTPLATIGNDPAYWTWTDDTGKVYTPRVTRQAKSTVEKDARNALSRAIGNYFGELKYQADNNIPISGKYTMPAIAMGALLPAVGEAVAGSSIAGVPVTTWADTALTSAFGAHGINHAVNEGINGLGDAAMTALEIAPLGRLVRPMYNAVKPTRNFIPTMESNMSGVRYAYNRNPELANIGTLEDYNDYLKMVFPESKVKDINYHMGPKGLQELNPSTGEVWNTNPYARGIYVTPDKSYAQMIRKFTTDRLEKPSAWTYLKRNLTPGGWDKANETFTDIYPVMVDTKKPLLTKGAWTWGIKDKKYKSLMDKYDAIVNSGPKWYQNFHSMPETIVPKTEQALILGSDADVAGFRKFMSAPQITVENAASITPAQWTAAQDAAVARGDMAEAQRLRDLHFRTYQNGDMVDVNGNPIHVYHGSPEENITEFYKPNDPRLPASKSINFKATGEEGIYTSPRRGYAARYMQDLGGRYHVHLTKEQKELLKAGKSREEIGLPPIPEGRIYDLYSNTSRVPEDLDINFNPFTLSTEEANIIKSKGYSGFDIPSRKYPEHVVLEPNQLKSADAVTYNNGVRIPLGDRDNFNSNDIRYDFNPFRIFKHRKAMSEKKVVMGLQEAKDYKESDGYNQLVRSFIDETGESDIPTEIFYSSRHSKMPKIVFEERPEGSLGGYRYSTNTLSVDPKQATSDVPIHEGFHWQRVGEVPYVHNNNRDYKAWAEAYHNNAPDETRRFLFNKLYDSGQLDKLDTQQAAIENLYKRKVDAVVKSSIPYEAEMRKPYELVAHSMGAGKEIGLKLFQEFPGVDKARKIIEKAKKYDSYLKDIKDTTDGEVRNFWKLLTANYLPVTAIGISTSGLGLNYKSE